MAVRLRRKPIWVKDKFATNPRSVYIDEGLMIIDFLHHIIELKLFKHWIQPLADNFIVTHNGKVIEHDMLLNNVKDISSRIPLIVEQKENFSVLLEAFMVTPSDNHHPKHIHSLVPESSDYPHFVRIVKSRAEELNLVPAAAPASPVTHNLFEFQQNEKSLSVHVALLLHAALQRMNLTIKPFMNLDLPYKKKGQPYQADFVIYRQCEPPTDEPPTEVNMVVFNKTTPIMVIEAKPGIPVDFLQVKAKHTIELLVYCHYIMRISNINIILGSLTDGNTWHTMKLKLERGHFTVMKTVLLSNIDEGIIVRNIPKLFDIL